MKVPPPDHAVVATYGSAPEVDQALAALLDARVDLGRLSLVGRDLNPREQATGFYTRGDTMTFVGGRAAFWGTLWGHFSASALFFIPSMGPLMVMGPLVEWLAGAVELGTRRVFSVALTSSGIPLDCLERYEEEVKAGKALLMMTGTPSQVEHARQVLRETGPSLLSAHTGAELLPERQGPRPN